MITGEYAVLDGALSLAIPTKYGQYLSVTENDSGEISWLSFDEKSEGWFKTSLNMESFEIKSTSHAEIAKTLQNILWTAKKANNAFLKGTSGLAVETKLTFPKDWGLGTSSTLINNIAQWAQVNAYYLLTQSMGGSGYDIACAQHQTPILYQLNKGFPKIEKLTFGPNFKNQLYFVYLNKKQNSRDGIEQYRKQEFDSAVFIQQISEITKEIIDCADLSTFEKLLTKHEHIISNIIKIAPVKTSLFPDYWGAIKSLGAWGGDFILATGNEKTPEYFKSKGFDTILPYKEMAL